MCPNLPIRMSYLRQYVRAFRPAFHHHARALPERDLLTRLRRDQSVAVAGRIAEIAQPAPDTPCMQLRKHAAPPLGDSFFTAGVAVPPDFTGTGAMPVTDSTDLLALPPGDARLVSAGRLMSASAMTAIAKLRYMSVSFVWRIVSTSSIPHSGFELCEGHHGMTI